MFLQAPAISLQRNLQAKLHQKFEFGVRLPTAVPLFSSLDTDHYLCWFLQVLESQVLRDEIMYLLCHLRVLEPPVFAALYRV